MSDAVKWKDQQDGVTTKRGSEMDLHMVVVVNFTVSFFSMSISFFLQTVYFSIKERASRIRLKGVFASLDIRLPKVLLVCELS